MGLTLVLMKLCLNLILGTTDGNLTAYVRQNMAFYGTVPPFQDPGIGHLGISKNGGYTKTVGSEGNIP